VNQTTRRGFLAAAAGVAVAGAAGLAAVGPRRIYDHFTRDEGPPARLPSHSGPTIERGELDSAHTASPVGWVIAVPPGADAAAIPICFCLPGRGTDAAQIEGIGFLDLIAEAAAKRGVAPFTAASLDAGNSFFHPRATGENRLALLLDEFIPFVEARLGLENPARGLWGWSMGGYGSLLAAETQPERFRAVVAVAPALWRTHDEQASAVPEAFDGAQDYAAHDVFAHPERLARIALRVDVGADDPFRAADEAFRGLFDPPPAGGVLPGVHSVDTFLRFAPAEIDFLGTSLA
jgi:hypothetical protein